MFDEIVTIRHEAMKKGAPVPSILSIPNSRKEEFCLMLKDRFEIKPKKFLKKRGCLLGMQVVLSDNEEVTVL